ncbi:Aste57867_5908 [Aphanomyces stellatus]|uniref:Aste57867_5908 protein n=1 Tax=Aphanomyces stellatus TaxID=120398 RepID=A0A485KF71_9STRA|nr:hypothetical protein As57867_005894 [Aphanomyces stellatus]VFT82929.1 Aste57867_5908 [Aphanomyces stellatus]
MDARRDEREERTRRGSQDETVLTPRSGGHRSIHDRVGGREKSHSTSDLRTTNSPRKRTDSQDEENPMKRRRLSATNVKPTEADPKSLQRSRRMFGALMGHLGRAKKQLAQDSDLLQKQDRLLSAAEAKVKEHSARVQTLAEQRQARRKVESQIAATKREAADKIAKLERKHSLSMSSERHQARFLQTVSPTPIFYLPARHTKETQALVDASMEAIEEKIQAQRREIDSKKREIEHESKRKLESLEAELAQMEKPKTKNDDDSNNDRRATTKESPDESKHDDEGDKHDAENDDSKVDEEETKERDDDDIHDDDVETKTVSPKKTPASPSTKPASPLKAVATTPVTKPASPSKPPSPTKGTPPRQDVTKPASPTKPTSPTKAAKSSTEVTKPASPTKAAVKPQSPTKSPSKKAMSPTKAATVVKTEEIEDTVAHEDPKEDEEKIKADDQSSEAVIVPSKLKVVELKELLKERGLDTKGRKDDLVKRLEAALSQA